MDEIWNVNAKQISLEYKSTHFQWMDNIIAMMQKEKPWIVGGGVNSLTWIMKGSSNFAAKLWWMLVHCQQSHTNKDNMVNKDRATLASIIMESYMIDVAKFIYPKIHD